MLMPLAAAKEYDLKLIQYWSEIKFELVQDRFNSEEDQYTKISLPKYYDDCLRIQQTSDDHDSIIGLYFIHELVPSFSPWNSPISFWSSPIRRDSTNRSVGDVLSTYFINSNLSLIELYDASFDLKEFEELNKITTLKILGLPKSGLIFNQEFSFPQNLEKLIVRRSTLNHYFFSALNNLSNLKELILIDCSSDLESPTMTGFTFDHERSWNDLPRIFEVTSKSLEKIVIKESDPELFNYLIFEKWPKLRHVQLEIFDRNIYGIRALLIPSEHLRKTFPALSDFNIDVISTHFDEVSRLMDSHLKEDNDKTWSSNIGLYLE